MTAQNNVSLVGKNMLICAESAQQSHVAWATGGSRPPVRPGWWPIPGLVTLSRYKPSRSAMCRFVQFADEMRMTMTCCGSPARTIDITMPSGAVAMDYCARCDNRRWLHEGNEIAVNDVVALAAKDWRKTRLWQTSAKLQTV